MKLSVLIPTYNHEKFIGKAIEGALKQETDFEFEILIGEDDSEDRTREICKHYARKNPEQIRLFLNNRKNVIYIDGKPTGRANLINLLKNASGEYIALCEGDDFWTDKHKLQIQYNFLEKNFDTALCFHKVNWLVNNKLEKDPGIFPKNRNWYTAEDILLYDNFIRTCSVVFRNNFNVRLPQWFYTVPYGDVALHMLNAQSGKIGFIDKEMGVYRVHKGGIYTGKNNIVKWMGSIETYKIIAENLGYNENLNFKTGLSKLYYAIAIEGKRLGDYYVNKVSEKTYKIKIKHQIYHKGDLIKNYSHINTNVSNTLASRKNQPNKVLDKIYSAQGNHIEKLNILFVSHNFPPEHFAGVENYTYQLAKGMAKYGHQVSVFYPNIRFGQDKVKLEKSKYDNLTIYKIFVKNNNDIISHIKNHEIEELFSNLINKNIFDIIHFQHTYHYLPFSLIEIAKDKKIPVCITLHDFWFMCLRTHMFIENKKKICSGPESAEKCVKCVFEDTTIYMEKERCQALTKLLEYRCKYIRKLFKEVDIIAAPSQYLFYKYTSYNLGLNNIEILPLGIKPVEICRRNNNRNNINFGYIGSIQKLKNIEYLVDEFVTLKGNSKLIIRGNGLKKSIEELKSKIKFFDNIDYKGPYSPTELPQILSEFDVLIVPSYIENYPLVVREALSAKIPVIASNVGGIPEIITHMENGILFNPKIKGELKKHLINIVRKPELIKNLKKNIKVPKTINEEVKEWEEKYLRLVFPKNKKVTCSIIIPVFNRVEFTKKCIEAILRNTPSELYEIIVIDNASSDKTKMFLSNIENRIKVIYNKKNIGFAKACNQGANIGISKYLLFLNNDTEVQPGWMNALIEVLDEDESVAAVGSKMLFPDNSIQHAGVVIINDQKLPDPLVARHIYYRQDCNYPMANVMSTYQALTAACMLVRKSSFKAVGGFDEKYWNGYEDIDLCFKLQKHGSLLIYQPKSVVIHYESKSGSERFNRTKKNIERLHKKWIGKINPDLMITPSGKIIETGSGFIRPYQIKNSVSPAFIGSTALNEKFTSIIILTYNQIEYTKKCFKSILKNTSGQFELIVVDNGSNDGTVQYLESGILNKHGDVRIKIIKNTENKGFASGNNQGIAASIGDYILIMNNDVVVTPGWLERMIACCEKKPHVGIVGPRSNYVSGPQLIESVDYNLNSLEGLNRFSEKIATLNAKKSSRLLRVVGFCMLINRSVIDKIGGIDNQYGIGNFEDDDFSLRAALAGFESWMAEDCFVHHFGSRTFIGEKIDYRKSLHKNWNIFKDKWGLPADLPYGYPYSISQMKVNKFNPQVHYIPISKNSDKPVQDWIENVSTVEQEYSTVCSSFEKENLEIAIEKLQEFADKYKDFAKVYNDIGVFYYQTGNNESALKHYRKALNLDQNNISFRKNLADLLAVAFAEYEEALQHYVTVLASEPKDVEALLATGHICARLERYDDAAEFYEKVLETEPHNSDAQNWLAKMREKSPTNFLEFDLNSCYLTLLSEIAQEDLAGAITKIENFIEMYPTHGQAHNDLGVLFYKNESKTKVLAHYLKAVELEPENVTYRKNLADFLYVEEGRVEEALENYVEVLRIKPDDVETLLISGHICTAIERFEDAMSFYHQVLDLEPKNLDACQNMEALKKRQILMLNQEARDEEKPDDDTKINQAEPRASVDKVPIVQDGVIEELINKAHLLFQQERIDQAVDSMLKAIAVNPSDGRTYVELAGQLVNYGRHENALEVLAEMPAKQPVAVATQKLLVEGYAEERMGNYAAAKKCCDGVLAREPKNAKAFNLNGILDYRNGDKATAEQQFKRAIELDSEYGEPHTNLGALVWETSEPKMALDHYERGFSISPTDIDVANAYHEVVTAAGEYKRAEKVARSVLNQYPQCRKVLYLLIDTLIRQEKTEEALNVLENALSTFGIDEGLLDTALTFRNRVGKTKKTGSAKRPGVSLCMIVKDEEANLARCLASVKPIVDEMVVVDTGSKDRTRDIAEFFGARVYEFEWSNDFAAARNFSISKAKGDWILIMDADEVISSQDYDHLRKITAKKSEKPVAYSVATRNYCYEANTIGWSPNDGHYVQEEAGFGWLSSEKVRLFSNRKKIKFEGAVHEMVDPVLKRIGIKIKKSVIPVHHYGRLNTDLLNKKRRIYYEIGQKKLAENGSSIGAVRELAIQATALEKNSEAIKLWKKFLSMKPDSRSVPEAYVNMGSAYIRMKDYEKALTSAQKAVEFRPEMKEAQYNLGMAELYNGNADAAVMTLKRLIKNYPNFPPAQFLFAASNCCKNDSSDRNGELKALKRSSFGRVLTYSVAELAKGLMTADQHKLALKLLLRAIEEEIVSKDIMNLYAACIKEINEDSRNLGRLKIPEEADILQETKALNK